MTETGRGGPGPCVRFLVVWFALLALPAWEGARAAAPAFPAGGRVRFAVTMGPLEIGRAEHGWRIDGGSYRLRSTLETTGLAALFKPERLLQQSEGGYGRRGFLPLHFSVTRNGKPAAKLVAISTVPIAQRIGVAKGLFEVPDDIDAHNDEVARLFLGGGAP